MHEMATVSAVLAALLLPLLLMQSVPTHPEVEISHPNILSTIAGGAATTNNAQQTPASAAQPLSDNARTELLMGYDILTNVFTGQSKLWLVPTLRKISRGSPLLDETLEIIQKLSDKGSQRKQDLIKQRIRHLHPSVSQTWVDPYPNKLIDSVAQNIVWHLFQDLSVRGDEFDLNFGIVQMAASRIVSSLASGMLKFETNAIRRRWLMDIVKENDLLHKEIKTLIMQYISGDRIFLGNGQAIRPSDNGRKQIL